MSDQPITIGDQPANCACFICECVFANQRPARVLLYDRDGDLQFLCGDDTHITEDPRIVCLGEVIGYFSDHLDPIMKLTPGHVARISNDGILVVGPIAPKP